MGYLFDVVTAVPIGILYHFVINKFAELATDDMKIDEKIQKNIVISFVAGLVGIVLAMSLFEENKALENRAVKYGIFTGSVFLMINTLIFNWVILGNDTKLFVLISLLFFVVGMSYKYKYYSNKIVKQKL